MRSSVEPRPFNRLHLFTSTAQEAAHWEETAGEDQHVFGPAERHSDRSVPTWCEYSLTPLLHLCVNTWGWIVLTETLLVSQQQSKLEKADILEMTVKHLQDIQSHKLSGEGHRLIQPVYLTLCLTVVTLALMHGNFELSCLFSCLMSCDPMGRNSVLHHLWPSWHWPAGGSSSICSAWYHSPLQMCIH